MFKKILKYLIIRWKRLRILTGFLFKKKNKKREKVVVFDIKAPNIFSRHLVNPSQFFLKNDYAIIFIFRKNLINQFGYYYKLINKNPNVRIKLSKPKGFTYYLTNNPKNEKEIHLKPDLFGVENYVKNYHRIPPPMHPLVYEDNTYKKILQLKDNLKGKESDYKIVFAGNLIESDYKNFLWGKEFYTNRVKLVELIKKEFSELVFVPRSFDEYKTGSDKKICIIDRKYFSLDLGEYFTFLQSGEFALCPPGIRQPFCHNLIESMFIGCIPIIQYGHLLSPPLENGINSIKYSNSNDLIENINQVLELGKNEVESLRRNVSRYYDNYLEPSSVITNFKKSVDNNITTLYIPAGT